MVVRSVEAGTFLGGFEGFEGKCLGTKENVDETVPKPIRFSAMTL